jgi:hypothetical protein
MRAILLIISLFCMTVFMQAQSVVVSTDILVGKHLANSAVDSGAGTGGVVIPVIYTGQSHPGLSYGAYPDSIRLSYVATDTTSGYLRFKSTYSQSYGTYSTDSIGVILTTANPGTGGYTVSKSVWNYKQYVGVAYNSKASGNGVLSTHKVWVRVDRFFTASR